MSNMWQRPAVALQFGLSGLILFVSAACVGTSAAAPSCTPGTGVTVQASTAPPNTPGMESTIQAGQKAGGTDIPAPAPGSKASSGITGESPATVNVLKDTSGSLLPRDGSGGDGRTLPAPDKSEVKYPNLGSGLDGLVASVEAGQATAREAAAGMPVHSGELVAVTIHLTGSVDEVVACLEENGGDPPNVGEDYIEAYVPVHLQGPVADLPGAQGAGGGRVRLLAL